MRKIGEGWQYSIYDRGDGRVLKKFHSALKAYWVILKTIFPFRDDPIWVLPSFKNSMKRKALASFEILKKKHIPSEWIGNPTFLNELNFEQDKVRPLHKVFENATLDDIKKIVDKFIIFNKNLLNFGVIDKSFNITKNYGLNDKDEIVLLDIGELFDDPKLIERQIKNRAWDKSYVTGCIINDEARTYFIEEMDKNFGLGSLSKRTKTVFKAAIFDLNGIFVQSPLLSVRFEKDFGIPASLFLPKLKEIMEKVRKPGAEKAFNYWQPVLREWGVEMSESEFWDYCFSAEKPSERMISFAKLLRSKGVKVFILSNNFKERAEYYSHYPWIHDAVDKVYFSFQTGHRKPDPRAWEMLLSENNLRAGECIYFDDDKKNVQAAENIGIKSFLFTNEEELEKTVLDGKTAL